MSPEELARLEMVEARIAALYELLGVVEVQPEPEAQKADPLEAGHQKFLRRVRAQVA